MSTSNETLVAVVGIGLVGTEFVNQLLSLPSNVPKSYKILSLSTSKITYFDAKGLQLPIGGWKSYLTNLPPSDLNSAIDHLKNLAKSNRVVLVDNTSDVGIARIYADLISAGISVITPNKKAYSGSLAEYKKIRAAIESSTNGARLMDEATVGAGLPIISTLKTLIATGDEINKIEGVFSGTMSYIFNNFSTAQPSGPSFSDVVRKARESGYTEPHPGDDLNGADVARKLTILSRYIPSMQDQLPEGYSSSAVDSLVLPPLDKIKSGDDFMAKLPQFDPYFDNLRAEAAKEHKVLRFVGVIDVNATSNAVSAKLEKYPVDHAFATSLGGSDNIVMFHTKRYATRPLIVQGAGAGAAVTAMGVLGDLLTMTDALR